MIDVLIARDIKTQIGYGHHYRYTKNGNVGNPVSRDYGRTVNRCKPQHILGRHPFNIITEEIYND